MNTNNTYSFDNLSLDDLKTVMTKIYKGSSQQEVIQATDYLTAFGSTIQSVPIFVQLATQESVTEIRLLAAVLLKKHIAQHLKAMGNEDRQTLQNAILARFFDEPLRKIKRTLAVLVSVMMKKGFELEQPWNEPLMIISQKIKADQSEDVRLQGFLLLSTVLEFTGEHLSSFYEDLFKFFFETMADNSAIIRKQTMLCVLNMFTSVTEVILIESFSHIYPMILETFYQSLQEEDEDTIEKTLEMFSALTQERNDLFDNSKLTKLIEIFCSPQGLLSKTLNPLFIEGMIDVLQNIVMSFKSVITKSETMLRKIVEIIFTLACRKEEKDAEEKDTIQDVALFFIRQAGQYLPKKKSYPIFKEYLVKMFASENEQVVEGAFMALGELAEGCVEYLKRDLPTIMKNFIQKGLESNNSDIKQATFYAINMFASFLSPDVMVYHPMIVPVLIKNLDMTDQKGLLSNVQSLVLFCEEMADSIMGYIPELIPRLITVVDKAENQIIVKSCAIQAIASCAEAAEDKFAQYASELLPLLAQLININEKDYVSVKSTSIKCVGLIIGHCLKNNPGVIADSLESLITTIYEGFKVTENTELKENSFVFFYNLATFLGAGFKPYLEKIIGLVFSTIENQQKLQEIRKPKVISLDSDSEDENDPNNFYVDENLVEELAAAICCLGEMALACPSEYGPYYEKTVEVLSSYAKFFHYTVRTQVLRCYKNLAVAIVKLGNGGEIPKFTHGVPCGKRFSADAEKFLYGEVYDKILDTFETDEHIQLLITATEVIQEFCMDLGPAAVDRKLPEIVHHLIKIFKNDTNAQNQAYEGEEEVHSELFGSTTLVVDLLMKICREGFLNHFDQIYPELKKFAVSEDIAEDDVAEVIGCFAQAVKYMPTAAQIYGLDMLEICVKAIEFGDEYINNNVAYCMGLIVEAGKEKIYDHYRVIMEKLRVIFENSMLPDTRDNAISSLARMVYTNPSLVPLKMVLPNLLSEMPLKGDFKEHRTCVKMLIFLLETDATVLSGSEGKCVDLLIDAVMERKKYKIKDENMIKAIGNILKNLSGNESGKQMIQESASKLSQENVEILTQLLNAQY